MFFFKKKEQAPKQPKPHERRPSWFLRLGATAIDLGICAALLKLARFNATGTATDILIPIFIALYYYAIETIYGRTLGKIILRMKMTDAKGQKPGRIRLLWRTFFRLVFWFVMWPSWKRVTLLDFVSGCRVEKFDAPQIADQKTPEKPNPVGWR